MTSPGVRTMRDVERFQGRVIRVATEGWPSPDSLEDERVGVVGPAVEVSHRVRALLSRGTRVILFDADIPWVLPPEAKFLPRALHRAAGRRYLRYAVEDDWLRDRLTPKGTRYVAPATFQRGFYELFTEEGCDLVTWPLAGAVRGGLRSADGIEHRLDALVLADEV